ncbi:DUF805 domain-containing protein [Parvularcula sp. LCG005]|uniref:DUF805 domain-containing protein n=1 Tax=Parvularcula sp. LCG005 TaxID=3078805 RepID=UPI0029422BF6|nr:DUF805 domain-containing protein [Parvularcula sp. LCG005]WOI54591.1 DUF805 domain-containing protein [Parvularcula sp. LCG005]
MFDFLFNTKGRISRKGYLLAFLLPYIALAEILPRILHAMGLTSGIVIVFFGLLSLFYLWPKVFAVPVRRFHDMGLTGWFHAGVLGLVMLALIIMLQGIFNEIGDLVAFSEIDNQQQQTAVTAAMEESGRFKLGLILFNSVFLLEALLFAIKPGTPGPNKFGNDPLESGRGYAD